MFAHSYKIFKMNSNYLPCLHIAQVLLECVFTTIFYSDLQPYSKWEVQCLPLTKLLPWSQDQNHEKSF